MVKRSPLEITGKKIIHEVLADGELNTYGVLEKDTVEVYIRQDRHGNDWEKTITYRPGKDGLGKKATLPENKLHDFINRYPAGKGLEIEKKLSHPLYRMAVQQLGEHVAHSLMCKLTVRVMKGLEFMAVRAAEARVKKGLEKHAVVECRLPVTFEGTLVDLETTAIEPEKGMVVSAGILHGNKVNVYFNAPGEKGFPPRTL